MTRPPSKEKSAEPEITPPDDLKEAIEKAVGNIVPARQTKQIVDQIATAVILREQFSGPLPHPRHLREYADLIPDGPNRIMTMAEDSLRHQRAQEEKALSAEVSERKLGILLGFAAFIALILAAIGTAWIGAHPSVPIALVGASAIGGISVLIKGRSK